VHQLDRIKVIVGIANIRGVLTGVTVVLAAAAWAASPKESYIAARDHYIAKFRALDDVRRNQEKGADDAYALYLAGDKKDEKLLDQYTELRQEADTLFLRCFAEHAPTQEAFAVAVIQAQSLLDDLPLRDKLLPPEIGPSRIVTPLHDFGRKRGIADMEGCGA
jgi:hypothetical protein